MDIEIGLAHARHRRRVTRCSWLVMMWGFCQGAEVLLEIPHSDVIMVSMTAADNELVDWLLEGDPSIRWRVHRDLLGSPASTVLPSEPGSRRRAGAPS